MIRFDLMRFPFSTNARYIERDNQRLNYLYIYIFGICIARLHLDRSV